MAVGHHNFMTIRTIIFGIVEVVVFLRNRVAKVSPDYNLRKLKGCLIIKCIKTKRFGRLIIAFELLQEKCTNIVFM